MNRLIKPFDALLHFLYPPHCVGCDTLLGKEAKGILFCADCAAKVVRLSKTCFICGAPFVSEAAISHTPTHRCGECREKPPPFSKAITPFVYEGPLSTAICQFKYGKKPHLAAPLARLLVDDLRNVSVDRVMAIPLHPSRLRDREFNQSLLLAKEIANARSLPYSIDAIVRTQKTPPQVGLSRKEREENIKGAFGIRLQKEVTDCRILLMDDVYTTGATLKEAARILIGAGAKEVIVAAIARMVPSEVSAPLVERQGGEEGF